MCRLYTNIASFNIRNLSIHGFGICGSPVLEPISFEYQGTHIVLSFSIWFYLARSMSWADFLCQKLQIMSLLWKPVSDDSV